MTRILGIDSSSIVATAAVLSEKKLFSEYIVNNKKTHSEKMMAIVDQVLKDSGLTINDIDAIAVAKGPGSFTGIRIGMACVQGMAHALNKPLIGVNTLDGLAYNLMGTKDLLCPVINAQRQEVYTSLYRWEDCKLKRLWDYKLIKADTLLEELLGINENIVVLGDGLPILEDSLKNIGNQAEENIISAHPVFSMPRASSIATAALQEYIHGNIQDCFSIKPFYIRKSNAEEKWEEHHGAKSR